MVKCGAVFLLLLLVAAARAHSDDLQRLAEQVNAKGVGWTAAVGQRFLRATEASLAALVREVDPSGFRPKLADAALHRGVQVPDSFDARSQWPGCSSIGQVYDQANCASSFAFAAVEAMQDRMCIASGQQYQVRLSMEDVLECCSACGNGCLGGSVDEAWAHLEDSGTPTGGEYMNEEWCKPYFFAPCAHFGPSAKYPPCGQTAYAPACYFHCPNRYYLVPYGSDVHYVQSTSTLLPNQIAAEIVANGPVSATMDVYDDFFLYQSGVYAHQSTKKLGSQAVKIIGFGTENGKPYWLAVNSWNDSWGISGCFKIMRGTNECGVEARVVAGKVGPKSIPSHRVEQFGLQELMARLE